MEHHCAGSAFSFTLAYFLNFSVLASSVMPCLYIAFVGAPPHQGVCSEPYSSSRASILKRWPGFCVRFCLWLWHILLISRSSSELSKGSQDFFRNLYLIGEYSKFLQLQNLNLFFTLNIKFIWSDCVRIRRRCRCVDFFFNAAAAEEVGAFNKSGFIQV